MCYTHSMINKLILEELYFKKGMSMKDISEKLGCSVNKVSYWMKAHKLYRRSISESIYLLKNPNGDPFKFKEPKTKEENFLFGIGIGLYWGEGTKANKHSIRLGNTDPDLILTFIKFLEKFFSIKRNQLLFGLQIFNDIKSYQAKKFWLNYLSVSPNQFMKVTITKSVRKGTYKNKIKYGVLTLYFNNIKARNKMISLIESYRKKL